MKEGKSRVKAAFWLLGVGGVLITAAIIALYTPWLPIFDLRQVSISGNREIPTLDIARASQLRRGVPVAGVALSAVRARIESLPWVQRARVQRAFPHQIAIHIKERAAIAKITQTSGACLLVGEGGVIVATECAGRDVPAVRGVEVSSGEAGARVTTPGAAAFLDALSAAQLPGLVVSRVDLLGDLSVEVHASSGCVVRFGPLREAADRVRYLEAVCLAVDADEYLTIDLRFGGEATLVPRVRR
ncbi:MAG: FtsQ-type POTRA domain-containing protein [Candidatus Bipolaricaulota bacterium]